MMMMFNFPIFYFVLRHVDALNAYDCLFLSAALPFVSAVLNSAVLRFCECCPAVMLYNIKMNC